MLLENNYVCVFLLLVGCCLLLVMIVIIILIASTSSSSYYVAGICRSFLPLVRKARSSVLWIRLMCLCITTFLICFTVEAISQLFWRIVIIMISIFFSIIVIRRGLIAPLIFIIIWVLDCHLSSTISQILLLQIKVSKHIKPRYYETV